MKKALFVAMVSVSVGCDGGGKDSAPVCEVDVDRRLPENGATDAYYRGAVEWELSDPDPTATVSSAIAGELVFSSDGRWIRWVPSAPLTPETDYSATLTWCGGDDTISFRTSTTGLDLTAPDTMVGDTYAIRLADGRVLEPPGLGEVLTADLTTQILIGVQAIGGGEVDLVGAISTEFSDPPEQNYCNANIDFPALTFTDAPYFSVGPADLTLAIAGDIIDVFDLVLTGAFTPDGSAIDGVTFNGTVDTRPLAPLVDQGSGDENAICELALNFGAECVACPSDGGVFCVTLEVDHLRAEKVDGLTLADVAASDCAGCLDGPPDPDTCG